MTPTQLASARQNLALSPVHSVWVSANAGTGKTEVLTRRMLTLLLTDLNLLPRHFLALTFSKAGAAEMVARLPDVLARWASLPADALRLRIHDDLGLTATDAMVARVPLLAEAVRHAPAVALTIHSLAQQWLGRYPLEAGVPIGFDLMDDDARNVMLRDVMYACLLRADGPLADYVATLLDELGDHGWKELSDLLMGNWRRVDTVLAHGGAAAVLARVRDGLGMPADGFNYQPIAPTAEEWQALRAVVAHTPDHPAAHVLAADGGMIEEVFADFLLTKDQPRKKLLLVGIQKAVGESVVATLDAAALRVAEIVRQRQVKRCYDLTEALLVWGGTVRAAYTAHKRERGLLDYDDLLHHFENLLQRDDVLAALERDFRHIFLDEAQDNNPQQDHIFRALARNALSSSDDTTPRSVLAVGDMKQSINRFQGAAPDLFMSLLNDLSSWLGEPRFRRVDLTHSFRSGRHILQAVDQTLGAHPTAAEVMGDFSGQDWPAHASVHDARLSRVELWPLITPQTPPPLAPWTLPHDRAAASDSHAELLCFARVGQWIQDLLARGVVMPSRHGTNQPLIPRDIMLLVQRNNQLRVAAGVLAKMGLPVAAAGIVPMLVNDITALLRLVFNPADNLSLAQVLKGLRGWDDEQLVRLGHSADREPWLRALPEAERLWLERYLPLAFGSPLPLVLRAVMDAGAMPLCEQLLSWAEKAPSLKDLIARLEREQLKSPPAPDGVRILTVHGSKGLQAPVVVMADTMSAMDDMRRDKIVFGEDVLLFKPSLNICALGDELIAAEQVRKRADSLRSLYVAMTRAQDLLVVAGWGKEKTKDTWWQLVRDAATEENGWRCDDEKWILGDDLW